MKKIIFILCMLCVTTLNNLFAASAMIEGSKFPWTTRSFDSFVDEEVSTSIGPILRLRYFSGLNEVGPPRFSLPNIRRLRDDKFDQYYQNQNVALKYIEDLLGHFVPIRSQPTNGLSEFLAGETVLTQESVVKILHLGYDGDRLNLGDNKPDEPFQNPAYFKNHKHCDGESQDHPGEPEHMAFKNKYGNDDEVCRSLPAEGMSWIFIDQVLIPTINKIIKDTGYTVAWLSDPQIDLTHRGLETTIDGIERVRQTTYITGNDFNQELLGKFYYFYENSTNKKTKERQTYPVKSKNRNNLKIYFASGVIELTGDLFNPDGIGDPLRSARGCHYWLYARDCYLARRNRVLPSYAHSLHGVRLRLVRTSPSALLRLSRRSIKR